MLERLWVRPHYFPLCQTWIQALNRCRVASPFSCLSPLACPPGEPRRWAHLPLPLTSACGWERNACAHEATVSVHDLSSGEPAHAVRQCCCSVLVGSAPPQRLFPPFSLFLKLLTPSVIFMERGGFLSSPIPSACRCVSLLTSSVVTLVILIKLSLLFFFFF